MNVHPIKAIRRAGVPLAAWETADPSACVLSIIKSLNGKAQSTPLILWDIIRGFSGLNEPGTTATGEMDQTKDPSEALAILANKLPDKSICFFANAHRYLDDASVMQAVYNLRDNFKTRECLLVMLCPSMSLPVELKHDVVVINEPLPDQAEIKAIADSIIADAGVQDKVNGDLSTIVDTMLGLSAFAAEQVLSLSISPDGIDHAGLWERKRKMVEQTPGLSVWRGGETFDQLGGLDNLKRFLTSILTSGNTPVRAIGFIDEIEKALAGNAGDLSGVSQDQLGVMLREMQDSNIPGIILVGPAGTGKSAIAKASGSIAGAEVISMDLGAMTGSLVGESQRKIRSAMGVFKAISQGKSMIIATCNKLAALPPELRRRFTLGTFYVDLPTTEEQNAIWRIWLERYKLSTPLPPCEGWTGAEIRACCDVAYRAGIPVTEAAAYIVPVCKSASDQIEALRKQASGRFISASYPGVYQYKETQSVLGAGRRVMERSN